MDENNSLGRGRKSKLLLASALCAPCFCLGLQPASGTTVVIDSAFAADPTVFNATSNTTLQSVTNMVSLRPINLTDTVPFQINHTVTFAGPITGTGTLYALASNGTIIFTGNNTFSGGIKFDYGPTSTIQIGNGGTTGSYNGNFTGYQGTVVFNRSDTYTYSGFGALSFGTMQQAGTGTLILTGHNSINHGHLLISSGTVQFGNGGTTGQFSAASGASNAIINNGILAFNRSNSLWITDSITGAGTLIQEGSGTTYVEAPASTGNVIVTNGALYLYWYRPSTTSTISVANGTLYLDTGSYQASQFVIGNQGALILGNNGASLTGDILIAGTLAFQPGIPYDAPSASYAGSISGDGAVQVLAGTVTFTGSSTYTGGTSIASGVSLQLGNGGTTGSITGGVTDNGTLVFNRSDNVTFSGDISGTGRVIQNGSGTLILSGKNSYTGGTIIAYDGTLQIGTGGTSTGFGSSVVDDGALIFSHSDTITFNGSIDGRGTITQSGMGSLVLNGASPFTGGIIVSGGSVLVGDVTHPNASIDGGVTVNSGTTLRGHGTIGGAVVNNGIVAPGGSIGTLTVGSYAQTSGGTLDIEVAPGGADKLHVTGPASLGGTLKLDFASGTYATRSYAILDASSVTNTFSSVVMSNTPSNAIGLIYAPTSVSLIVEPTTEARLYGDFHRATFDAVETLDTQLFAHVATQYCSDPASAKHRDKEVSCPKLSAWLQGFGGAGSFDGSTADGAFSTRLAGAIGGVDYHSEDGYWVGVSAAYTRQILSLSNAAGKVTTDSFAFAVMGGAPLFQGRLDADGFYMMNSGDATRHPAGLAAAASKPKSDVWGGAVQYSQAVLIDDLIGHVRLNYASVNQNAFQETGNTPFDFSLQSLDTSSLYADAGLRLSHIWTLESGAMLIPGLSGSVRAIISKPSAVTASLAEAQGANFSVPAASQDDVAFVGGFGVTAQKHDGYTFYLRADGRVSGSVREGIISIGGCFHL